MHLQKHVLDQIVDRTPIATGPGEVATHIVDEQIVETLERTEIAALVRDHQLDQVLLACRLYAV